MKSLIRDKKDNVVVNFNIELGLSDKEDSGERIC